MKYSAAAIAIACLIGTAAYADDTPSKAQMTQVETALKAAGYSKWEKVEIDGDHYEVDDAIDASGKKFDLRLDAKSMKVTSKLPD